MTIEIGSFWVNDFGAFLRVYSSDGHDSVDIDTNKVIEKEVFQCEVTNAHGEVFTRYFSEESLRQYWKEAF